MHFGPIPKSNAAWLSSASCQLGRQRDIGVVVNIGKAFSVGFWKLPVFPTHGPSSLTFTPLGHISLAVLFIPSCWFVLLGTCSVRWQVLSAWERDFSLKFIHSLAGNPHSKAADLWHCCHHCSPKGSPDPGVRHGRHFPSVSSAAPTVQLDGGGAEPIGGVGRWQRWHCPQHWPWWGVELVLFQLFVTSFLQRWLHQEPCLELWCVLHYPLSQLIAKTSEPLPIILA